MNITNLRTQVAFYKAQAEKLTDPAMKAVMIQQAQIAQAKINKYESSKSDAYWAKIEAKYAEATVVESEEDNTTEETPKRRGRAKKQDAE